MGRSGMTRRAFFLMFSTARPRFDPGSSPVTPGPNPGGGGGRIWATSKINSQTKSQSNPIMRSGETRPPGPVIHRGKKMGGSSSSKTSPLATRLVGAGEPEAGDPVPCPGHVNGEHAARHGDLHPWPLTCPNRVRTATTLPVPVPQARGEIFHPPAQRSSPGPGPARWVHRSLRWPPLGKAGCDRMALPSWKRAWGSASARPG